MREAGEAYLLCCLTRAELLNSPIASCSVNRQEILEPGDFRIRVSAGSTEHCGCASLFHHLQLRAHVNGWEASWEVVFCKREKTHKVKEKCVAMGYGCSDSSAMVQHL